MIFVIGRFDLEWICVGVCALPILGPLLIFTPAMLRWQRRHDRRKADERGRGLFPVIPKRPENHDEL